MDVRSLSNYYEATFTHGVEPLYLSVGVLQASCEHLGIGLESIDKLLTNYDKIGVLIYYAMKRAYLADGKKLPANYSPELCACWIEEMEQSHFNGLQNKLITTTLHGKSLSELGVESEKKNKPQASKK